MANIPVGTRGEQKLLVTSEVAINFLGMEGARVLSTPHMIGYMERTCRDTVLPLLDTGYDTVGTHVNVAHLAAAPLGMAVTFSCEVTAVQDRRVQFRVGHHRRHLSGLPLRVSPTRRPEKTVEAGGTGLHGEAQTLFALFLREPRREFRDIDHCP